VAGLYQFIYSDHSQDSERKKKVGLVLENGKNMVLKTQVPQFVT
jgi:hypothetical protein